MTPVRLRLEGCAPQLRALTRERLTVLLPETWMVDDGATASDGILVSLDADVVADIDALVGAVEAARVDGLARRLTASRPGVTAPTNAGTIQPRGNAVAASDRDPSVPIGTRVLVPPDDLPPVGPLALRAFAPAIGISGYGNASRNLILGLRALGVDICFENEWLDAHPEVVEPAERALIERLGGEGSLDMPTLLYRPATMMDGGGFFDFYREMRSRGPVIAYTMFETDAIPPRWRAALDESEAVWVPSTFNRETFVAAGVRADKVRVVPIGLDSWRYDPDRETLELPERRATAFFAAFEWSPRKGTDVLLRAWAQAFAPGDDVVLYLRMASTDGETMLAKALAETGLRREALAPIVLLTQALPQDAYRTLLRSIDAFVLTSRGEAFCIPMLEAMSLGKPVIGTSFGGSSDFLDEETGFPLPGRHVPIDEAFSRTVPLYRGQRWIEPSVEAAAVALRRIVDDAPQARRRAALAFARAHVAFDRVATAKSAQRGLADLSRTRTEVVRGVAVVQGAAYGDDATGEATRDLVRKLVESGVAVSLVDAPPQSRTYLDPRTARMLGKARRRSVPAEALRIVVDQPGENADVLLCTRIPEANGRTAEYRQIWCADDALARELQTRGVPRELLRVVPTAVDVDCWTPDASHIRDAHEPLRIILFEADEGWFSCAATALRTLPGMPLGFTIAAHDEGEERRKHIETLLAAAWPLFDPSAPSRASFSITDWNRSAVERVHFVAAADVALLSPGFRPELREQLASSGVVVIDGNDGEQLRALANSYDLRWRVGRERRRAIVAAREQARTQAREAFTELALLQAPRALPNPTPRVFVAPGADATDDDVASARARAVHPVDRVEDATHLAVVDGGIRLAYGWDAGLIASLDAHPEAAVATARVLDAFASLGARAAFVGGKVHFQDQGKLAQGAPNRGARLVRADEQRSGPIWVAYDVFFGTEAPHEAALSLG